MGGRPKPPHGHRDHTPHTVTTIYRGTGGVERARSVEHCDCNNGSSHTTEAQWGGK